jgi:O-antigen/teichoic acid export membrane protein
VSVSADLLAIETGQRRGLGLRTTALPMAATRAAGLAAEFVTFALLARDLGPAGFGRLSAAFVVARYLGIFGDWGATLGGSRLVAPAEPDWAEVHRLVRWRTAVSSALTVAFAAVVWVVSPSLVPVATTIACRGLNRDWISLGRGRGGRAGASSVVQGAALVAGALVLADGRAVTAAWALAAGYLAGAAASVVLNHLPAAPRAARGRGGASDPWVAVMQVADQLLLTADTTLLVLLSSAGAAGIYAAVCRISSALLTAQGLVVAGLVPGMARLVRGEGPAALAALRRRCLRAGAAVGGAVLVGSPVALWLLPEIFGHAFAEGRGALAVLLVAVAVSACTIPLFPLALAAGRDRRVAAGAVVAAVGNVVANLVVIPRWSYGGAAVVMLASQCVLSANYLLLTRVRNEAGDR